MNCHELAPNFLRGNQKMEKPELGSSPINIRHARVARNGRRSKRSVARRFISYDFCRWRLRLPLQERSEQINGHRQEGGGVMLARDFAHGLKEAQLEGDGFFADERCSLNHFLGSLKLALGVDNLGPP